MSRLVRLIWLISAIAVLGFVAFVWPTLFRYDAITLGSGHRYPVRYNRITGATSMLSPSGWQPMAEQRPVLTRAMNDDELKKVVCRSGILGHDLFTECYNGNSFRVHGGLASVTVKNADNSLYLQREYKFDDTIPPLSSTPFGFVDLGFKVENGQSWSADLHGFSAEQ